MYDEDVDLNKRVVTLENEVAALKDLINFGKEPNFTSLRTLTQESVNINKKIVAQQERITSFEIIDRKSRSNIFYMVSLLVLVQLWRIASASIDMDYIKYLLGL